MGRCRPLGKGNAEGFEEFGNFNFLNLASWRGDEVKEVGGGGPAPLDDFFSGRGLLFVGRIWADYDGEIIDLVSCFGLKADGGEGFGESGFGEVEIFDDGLVRVGVGEDKVDAGGWFGAIEFECSQAEKFDGFVESGVIEGDFWELGFELAEDNRPVLHRGLVPGDQRSGQDDGEDGGDDQFGHGVD